MIIASRKKRPYIYALVVCIGFAFLLSMLGNLPDSFYFAGAFALYPILLFELYSTNFYGRRILQQFGLPALGDETAIVNVIHHVVLPTFSYFGIVMFLYFNNHPYFNPLWLVLIFLLYSVLFANIRAHYEDKFKLEEVTNYIYDILIILICFMTANGIVNSCRYAGLSSGYASILLVVLTTILSILTLLRYRMFRLSVLKGLVVFLLAVFILNLLLLGRGITALGVATADSLLVYYQIAFLNHKRDGSVTQGVVVEYIVVFLILIVILFGSSLSF